MTRTHLILLLSFALLLSCQLLPAAPASAGAVAAILASVKTAEPATVKAAEDSLVALGATAMPALRTAVTARQTAMAGTDPRQAPGEWRRLQLELDAADSAAVRLAWGSDPRATIEKFLEKIPAPVEQSYFRQVRPVRIADGAVARWFPEHLFFVLRIPSYPVARPVPADLRPMNLFVLAKDGSLEHLTEAVALQKLLPPLLEAARAREPKRLQSAEAKKDFTRAWLRITQEFSQDGMYRFSTPEDLLQVVAEKDAWKATGKSVVDPAGGNSGEVSVTLRFDAGGKLVQVLENHAVRPGVRPICQATKLLDADPIVRAMAEQDIVVMGRAAAGYLAEQHARATPETRAVIERLWRRIVEEGR